MSFAYLPLYTGDYLRDTADLTVAEHGIYLLLLIYCWDSRGPVPLDEARAGRIVGASSDDERNMVKYVLSTYFVRHDDGWYNPRMDREIARCNAISIDRSEAGKIGGTKSWNKRQASAQANAKQVLKQKPSNCISPSPSLSPALSPKEVQERVVANAPTTHAPKPVRQEKGTRLPDDWTLPDEWRDLAKAIRPDWSLQGIVRESISFRDFWHAKAGKDACKAKWLAVWRTWIRRANMEPAR